MENFLKSNGKLGKIGQGFCGTVWAEDAGALVIKRADGGPGRSLPNEQNIHTRILSAVASHSVNKIDTKRKETQEAKHDKETKADEESKGNEQNKQNPRESPRRVKVNIPSNVAFLEKNSTLWPRILPRLPEGFTSCEALISERIPPMKLAVRELLADHYCPSKQHAMQMARDKSNESCLIRPYLGRRRPDADHRGGPKQRFFSLRNFPLHIDQIEELDLPVEEYAMAMADALAFLHWTAKVDAGDVEYVLAAPRSNTDNAPSIGDRCLFAEAFGHHDMWILDFDCCRELEMNETGMRRAAMCFWRNDPFYPRPGAKTDRDRRLWDLFEAQFLMTSEGLLKEEEEEMRALPGILMRTIRENRDTWTKGAIN